MSGFQVRGGKREEGGEGREEGGKMMEERERWGGRTTIDKGEKWGNISPR